MSTLTIYRTTCNICDAIANVTKRVFARMIEMGETAGRSRAASELARQGYYKEAQALMMEIKSLRKEIEEESKWQH